MAKSNMTNINHNSLSKLWFSLFTPTPGYSAKIQYHTLLNLKLRNLFFFKNKATTLLYTKNNATVYKTYRHVKLKKRAQLTKNLVLKTLQVKMLTLRQTTNIFITVLNPEIFFALQHNEYAKIVSTSLVTLKKKQTTYIIRRLLALPIPIIWFCYNTYPD